MTSRFLVPVLVVGTALTPTAHMEADDADAFHGSLLTREVAGNERLTTLRVVTHPRMME